MRKKIEMFDEHGIISKSMQKKFNKAFKPLAKLVSDLQPTRSECYALAFCAISVVSLMFSFEMTQSDIRSWAKTSPKKRGKFPVL